MLMLRRFAWRRTVGTGPASCSSWETKAWATIVTCTSIPLLPWVHLWALLDNPLTSFSRPRAPKGSWSTNGEALGTPAPALALIQALPPALPTLPPAVTPAPARARGQTANTRSNRLERDQLPAQGRKRVRGKHEGRGGTVSRPQNVGDAALPCPDPALNAAGNRTVRTASPHCARPHRRAAAPTRGAATRTVHPHRTPPLHRDTSTVRPRTRVGVRRGR